MELRALLHDRRFVFAARFVLLVAIPFLLGLYTLPHVAYVDGQLLGTPSAQQNDSGELSYSFATGGNGALLEQVGSVFPLSNYLDFPPLVSHDRMQLCFRDNGSSLELPNGTLVSPDLTWEIHLNNEPAILLGANSQACADIAKDSRAYYAWTANISTDIDKSALEGQIVFHPQTLTWPRLVVDYGLLQGIVMIPVFYLLVWYPAIGIYRKLREGMLSQ